MNRQPYRRPPRWWSPKPSPFWVNFWRRGRKREQIQKQRLLGFDVDGLQHVQQALKDGWGVMITPNHASHADCFAIYEVADRLFFAIQLFSYPGDYVAEDPSIERIAETIDKLEEDVLGVQTASIRGSREARVTLGEPIPVPSGRRNRQSVTELTRLLETRVQGLLNAPSTGAHNA